MELNITKFFNECAPMDYSASRAEIGQNAGADTWRASVDDSPDYPILDTDEKREAFRAFVRGSGGWNDVEIAAWSDIELNALCLQWIAGDMREAGLEHATSFDWEEYARSDIMANRLFKGDDGEVYFYIGS